MHSFFVVVVQFKSEIAKVEFVCNQRYVANCLNEMFRIIPFITTRILTIHEIPHSFIAQSSIKISTFSAHGDETCRKFNIYPSKIIIFWLRPFLI